MPLNANDVYYRAEFTPASVDKLGTLCCQRWARPRDAFGGKGNLDHYYGYHRSRNWIIYSPDSRDRASDYSIQDPRDKGGSADNISAFDFTPGDWGTSANRALMKTITQRLLDAARANDPRLSHLREIAGTIDGVNVITFRAQGGALLRPFDPTHLDHLHGSFWRSMVALDHTDIFNVMAGITTGLAPREDATMFLANVQGTDEVVLVLGPVCRWVTAEELPHLIALHQEGTQPLTYGGKVRQLAFQSLAGEFVGRRPARLGHDAETQAVLDALKSINTDGWTDAEIQHLADLIIAAPNNGFSESQRRDLVVAAKTAAREGSATL